MGPVGRGESDLEQEVYPNGSLEKTRGPDPSLDHLIFLESKTSIRVDSS